MLNTISIQIVSGMLKESFNFKTRMPGTVKCRPTVAYRVQIDGINIATELNKILPKRDIDPMLF